MTEIAANGFANHNSITEICIPSTVERIGFNAFGGTSLIRITIPFVGGVRHASSIQDVQRRYFGYIFGAPNRNVQNKYAPETMREVIIKSGTIWDEAFYGLENITSVEMTEGITVIGRMLRYYRIR